MAGRWGEGVGHRHRLPRGHGGVARHWGDGTMGRCENRTRLERHADALHAACHAQPSSTLALEGNPANTINELCRLLIRFARRQGFNHPHWLPQRLLGQLDGGVMEPRMHLEHRQDASHTACPSPPSSALALEGSPVPSYNATCRLLIRFGMAQGCSRTSRFPGLDDGAMG